MRARGRTEDGSNASGQWTGWEERAPPRRAPEDRPRVARYESPQKNMNHVRETSRREVELSVRLSSLLHWDRALGTRSQKPDREECVQKRKLHTATFSAAPPRKARPCMRRYAWSSAHSASVPTRSTAPEEPAARSVVAGALELGPAKPLWRSTSHAERPKKNPLATPFLFKVS